MTLKLLCFCAYCFADLGVGRKDWLQLLQEQVKEDCQKNSFTNTSSNICEQIINDECVTKESQVEEKTKIDLDKLKQKQQQQNETCADATSSHLNAVLQNQQEEQDEAWSPSSSDSQRIEGAQQPSLEAPTTPLTSLFNTTLISPMLLLPSGG